MTEEHGMADTVDQLLSGLRKMPGYEGVTFRGRLRGDVFGVGRKSVVSTGLVATSRDARVATENFTTDGLYAVIGNQGRAVEQVSRFPEEREVVFLPSTTFLAVRTARVGDLPVVIIEQVDMQRDAKATPAPLDDVERLIAASVVKARQRPDVSITSPDKYVGDIE